jgi:hypothetical protein
LNPRLRRRRTTTVSRSLPEPPRKPRLRARGRRCDRRSSPLRPRASPRTGPPRQAARDLRLAAFRPASTRLSARFTASESGNADASLGSRMRTFVNRAPLNGFGRRRSFVKSSSGISAREEAEGSSAERLVNFFRVERALMTTRLPGADDPDRTTRLEMHHHEHSPGPRRTGTCAASTTRSACAPRGERASLTRSRRAEVLEKHLFQRTNRSRARRSLDADLGSRS